MREIKFRAWNKKLKTFAPDNCSVQIQGDEPHVSFDYFDGNFDTAIWCLDDVDLLQFTGLKDKNGVEIYEGDIVDCYWLADLVVCEMDCQHKGVARFVDCRFEVSFSDKAFIRNIGEDRLYSATEIELTCVSHDDNYAVEYEVIGNIYENPELLD